MFIITRITKVIECLFCTYSSIEESLSFFTSFYNKKFKYLNLEGSVNYCNNDKIWYGKIETMNGRKIKDLVTYEAESRIKLMKSFKDSCIDYYIDTTFLKERG